MDGDARKELLRIARETLECHLVDRPKPDYVPSTPALHQHSGAFVTLHNGDDLRGCIGFIQSDQELYRTVRQCAVSAATSDHRFESVTLQELPQIRIEISVLTPFRTIQNAEEVEVGKHGLFITRGFRRGLLLPQVATEWHWDREAFLDQTCRKAGLNEGEWREKGVKIEVFEAEVFGE
jgi:AmmeMemoRadiSam system protein A